jgi:molybdopterin-guanine dinucleotide biosynthesis protein A
VKPASNVRRPRIEAVILAGGLSKRMGTDKSRLKLNGRSVLSLIRSTVTTLGLPVRVNRKDAVARCGPLGGIVTALRTSKTDAVLFLACDMPLVSTALLRRLLRISRGGTRAALVLHRLQLGFPLLLPTSVRPDVESQIARGLLSIRELAHCLGAVTLEVPTASGELMNINTPEEKLQAERTLKRIAEKAKNRRRHLSRRQAPRMVHGHDKPADFTPAGGLSHRLNRKRGRHSTAR